MALVGSSRPLLELTSCKACAALEEEMALAKSTEQKEVAALSKVGQERRKRRKAARLARQRRRNSAPTPEGDPGRASTSGVVVGAASDPMTGPEADRGKEGSREGHAGDGAAVRSPGTSSGGCGDAEGAGFEEQKEEVKGEREEASADADDATAGADRGGNSEKDKGEQADEAAGPGGGVSPRGRGADADGPDQLQAQEPEQEQQPREQGEAVGEEEGQEESERCQEEEEEEREKWYLMAGTWLSRWHAYVLSGAGEDLDFPTPPPGPITNGDLVDDESVPIPGKIAGKHYRGAMTEVWSYLHERYGGGPVICRSDPDGLYE